VPAVYEWVKTFYSWPQPSTAGTVQIRETPFIDPPWSLQRVIVSGGLGLINNDGWSPDFGSPVFVHYAVNFELQLHSTNTSTEYLYRTLTGASPVIESSGLSGTHVDATVAWYFDWEAFEFDAQVRREGVANETYVILNSRAIKSSADTSYYVAQEAIGGILLQLLLSRPGP